MTGRLIPSITHSLTTELLFKDCTKRSTSDEEYHACSGLLFAKKLDFLSISIQQAVGLLLASEERGINECVRFCRQS